MACLKKWLVRARVIPTIKPPLWASFPPNHRGGCGCSGRSTKGKAGDELHLTPLELIERIAALVALAQDAVVQTSAHQLVRRGNSSYANVARKGCACHRPKRGIPTNLGQLAQGNHPSHPSRPQCAGLQCSKRVKCLRTCGWLSYPQALLNDQPINWLKAS